MIRKLSIVMTGVCLVLIAAGGTHAQEGDDRARAQQEAATAREEAAAARAELQEARERMEQSRRELEAAAREVAELSGGPMRWAYSGRNPRAMLGIVIEDSAEGVRVTGVTPGGAAAAAGIVVGDVVVAIEGVDLTGTGAAGRLVERMQDVEAGQNVGLRVLRDGAINDVAVTAREGGFMAWSGPGGNRMIWQGGPNVSIDEDGVRRMRANVARLQGLFGGRWNDLELVALTEGLGSYFGTTTGLLVVRAPDDDAIGLQEGDVILEIGGRAPTSPEHAMRILMSFEAGETLRFSIMRRQRRETVEYAIPGEEREG